MPSDVIDVPGAEALWVLLGVGLAGFGGTYRPLRPLATLVHEGAHAFVALLCGRRPVAIRIWRDSSGEALSVGSARGFSVMLTLLAGYPGPGIFGLWALAAVRWDVVAGFVAVSALAAGWVLILVRNVFAGVVLMLVALPLVYLPYAYGQQALAPMLLAVGGFLVVAGFRGSLEQFGLRSSGHDAASLAGSRRLGTRLWQTFFVLLCGATLAAAGWVTEPWFRALWLWLKPA